MFFTYILLCSDNSYYTGITNSLLRRMDEHANGKSKSTRAKRPLKLIYTKPFATRKESRALEVHIKKRGAKRFLLQEKFKPKAT